nr:hypothetical protein [Paenibacillus sp.]
MAKLLQVHRRQRLLYPPLDFRRRHPQILRAEGRLILWGPLHQLRIGVLEDQSAPLCNLGNFCRRRIDSCQIQFAFSRASTAAWQITTQQLAQRRLAAAARADDRRPFPFRNRQRQPLQRRFPLVIVIIK